MSVEIKSTIAKVREPDKVRELLDSYGTQGVEILLSEEDGVWNVRMAFKDDMFAYSDWPMALHRSQWPSDEQYPDEDEWFDAIDELYQEEGAKGFLALLRELAPYLETPVLVLWLVGTDYSAGKAWLVQPGANEVATLEIVL